MDTNILRVVPTPGNKSPPLKGLSSPDVSKYASSFEKNIDLSKIPTLNSIKNESKTIEIPNLNFTPEGNSTTDDSKDDLKKDTPIFSFNENRKEFNFNSLNNMNSFESIYGKKSSIISPPSTESKKSSSRERSGMIFNSRMGKTPSSTSSIRSRKSSNAEINSILPKSNLSKIKNYDEKISKDSTPISKIDINSTLPKSFYLENSSKETTPNSKIEINSILPKSNLSKIKKYNTEEESVSSSIKRNSLFNKPREEKVEKEEKKINIKQTIEPTRLFSKAPKKTIANEDPDWDNLPQEEQDYYFNEYNVRFNILIKNNSKFKIEKPKVDTLSALVHAYECSVRMISTEMCTANWKVFLGLMYYGVEILMVNLFKIKLFSGYGKFQNDKMKLYEQSMIELGEMYAVQEEENSSPLWSILKISLTQSIVFIIAGFITKYINVISKDSILNTIDSFYNNTKVKYGDDGIPQDPNSNSASDPSSILNMVGGVAGLGNVLGGFMNNNGGNKAEKTQSNKEKTMDKVGKGSDPLKGNNDRNDVKTSKSPYARKKKSV